MSPVGRFPLHRIPLDDIFLRPPTTSTYVGIATTVEWLVAIALLAVWVPKVEGKELNSIGIGKFKWRYIRWEVLAFVVATIVDGLISPMLSFFGLQSKQTLQPTLKAFGFPVLISLFLTGTCASSRWLVYGAPAAPH
jgi:hypothetical protein